jgi:hypothetical protein
LPEYLELSEKRQAVGVETSKTKKKLQNDEIKNNNPSVVLILKSNSSPIEL